MSSSTGQAGAFTRALISLLLPCLNSPTTMTRTSGSSSRAWVCSRRLARSARPVEAANSLRLRTMAVMSDAGASTFGVGATSASGSAASSRSASRRPRAGSLLALHDLARSPRSTSMSARVRPLRTPRCCPFPARAPQFHRDRSAGRVCPALPRSIRPGSEREKSSPVAPPSSTASLSDVITPDAVGVDVPVGRIDVLDLRGEQVRRGGSANGVSEVVAPRIRTERVIGVDRHRPAAPARHRAAGGPANSLRRRWTSLTPSGWGLVNSSLHHHPLPDGGVPGRPRGRPGRTCRST